MHSIAKRLLLGIAVNQNPIGKGLSGWPRMKWENIINKYHGALGYRRGIKGFCGWTQIAGKMIGTKGWS